MGVGISMWMQYVLYFKVDGDNIFSERQGAWVGNGQFDDGVRVCSLGVARLRCEDTKEERG